MLCPVLKVGTREENGRPAMAGNGPGKNGFTMIECIVLITIMGILAVVTAPMFSSHNDLRVRSAADMLVADIRNAQGLAMRISNPANDVRFRIDVDGMGDSRYAITITNTNNPIYAKTVVFSPQGDYRYLHNVGLSAADFTFNRQGQPNIAGDLNIIVSEGAAQATVRVTQETGRVGIQ